MAAVEGVQLQAAVPADNRLEFPVDSDHASLRAGCLVFGITSVVTGVVLNALLPGAAIPVVLASLLAGAATSWLLENRLKQRLNSGRSLLISADSLQINRGSRAEVTLKPQQQVNVLAWRFEVPRNGRVKKGWYVVALALEQDDFYLPLYTFVAPDRFKDMPLANHFEPLQRPGKAEKGSGSAREMKLAGQQRRLYEAEKYRHMDGAELPLEAFEQVLRVLQERFPAWMPD
ncbi:MAG: hypothetical protein MUE40_05335 [Anaerolineae bacterium]|jgi:hypothetical protein|nr:hypothetical protein [Anaerolineae bacterium]